MCLFLPGDLCGEYYPAFMMNARENRSKELFVNKKGRRTNSFSLQRVAEPRHREHGENRTIEPQRRKEREEKQQQQKIYLCHGDHGERPETKKQILTTGRTGKHGAKSRSQKRETRNKIFATENAEITEV